MIVIIEKKATIWMRRLTSGLLLRREPKDSVSKARWPHITSDLSAFLQNVEKLPTNLNYPRTFPEYIMYSMCHNSGVASRTPSAKSTMKRLISKMTFLIENTPFVFLTHQSVSLAVRRSCSSKYNGHTTLREKPRGKEKTVSVPSTPPSFRRLLNLGTRFFRVGASCHRSEENTSELQSRLQL